MVLLAVNRIDQLGLRRNSARIDAADTRPRVSLWNLDRHVYVGHLRRDTLCVLDGVKERQARIDHCTFRA